MYNRYSSCLKERHIVRRVSAFNGRKYPLTERMLWHGLLVMPMRPLMVSESDARPAGHDIVVGQGLPQGTTDRPPLPAPLPLVYHLRYVTVMFQKRSSQKGFA